MGSRTELTAIARFRVLEAEGPDFLGRAEAALGALRVRPGYLSGSLGRSLDDATLWSMVTRWEGPGAYRRALSAYDVKVTAVPLLSLAIDEPGAYEVLAGDPFDADHAEGREKRTGFTARALDADTVALGDAAAPDVATSLDASRRP